MSKTTRRLIAIVASDLHLSHIAPASRKERGDDWYRVMAKHLGEISHHRQRSDGTEAPLLIAGDIFDRWNACPELVNFAIDYLPKCYAIPGNHDLPYHRISDVGKSAYGTLTRAKIIRSLHEVDEHPVSETMKDYFMVSGFSWGRELKPCTSSTKRLKIALIHKYVWDGQFSHPGASEESKAKNVMESLKGFDIAFFGDNHMPFMLEADEGGKYPTMVNCGGFIRRSIDDLGYKPSIYKVYNQIPFVKRIYLAAPDSDNFHSPAKQQMIATHDGGIVFDTQDFIELLKTSTTENKTTDFKNYLRLVIDNKKIKVSEDCKRLIYHFLDGVE